MDYQILKRKFYPLSHNNSKNIYEHFDEDYIGWGTCRYLFSLAILN